MAGNHFGFENFKQLLSLNMGISARLDENRAESFTLLYCDFSTVAKDLITESLQNALRASDSIVNNKGDYFFVLPYTDKYGADIVKKIFDENFSCYLTSSFVSYPIDGKTSEALLNNLKETTKFCCKKNLTCLNKFLK